MAPGFAPMTFRTCVVTHNHQIRAPTLFAHYLYTLSLTLCLCLHGLSIPVSFSLSSIFILNLYFLYFLDLYLYYHLSLYLYLYYLFPLSEDLSQSIWPLILSYFRSMQLINLTAFSLSISFNTSPILLVLLLSNTSMLSILKQAMSLLGRFPGKKQL